MTLASGAPATIDEYLADKGETAAALFRVFHSLVERCGPSEAVVSRTVVFFKRKRTFAGAFVRGTRLEVVVDLLREVEHPLLLASFPTTKKVFSHRLRIESPEQLDDVVASLVQEAYETVGPGTRGR